MSYEELIRRAVQEMMIDVLREHGASAGGSLQRLDMANNGAMLTTSDGHRYVVEVTHHKPERTNA